MSLLQMFHPVMPPHILMTTIGLALDWYSSSSSYGTMFHVSKRLVLTWNIVPYELELEYQSSAGLMLLLSCFLLLEPPNLLWQRE